MTERLSQEAGFGEGGDWEACDLEAGDLDRALRRTFEVDPDRVRRVRDGVRARIEAEAVAVAAAEATFRGRRRFWWAAAAALLVAGIGVGRSVWQEVEARSERRVASRTMASSSMAPTLAAAPMRSGGVAEPGVAAGDSEIEAAGALLQIAFEDALRLDG